jgi:hypothetical protein
MTKGFEGSVYHRSHEYALLDVILKSSTWFLVWSCRGSDMESTTDVLLASLCVFKNRRWPAHSLLRLLCALLLLFIHVHAPFLRAWNPRACLAFTVFARAHLWHKPLANLTNRHFDVHGQSGFLTSLCCLGWKLYASFQTSFHSLHSPSAWLYLLPLLCLDTTSVATGNF